jgi:hypothetical protein
MLPAASYRIHWVEIWVSFDELLELFLGEAQGIFQARPETIMIDGQGRGHCIFFEADFSGATNTNCRQLGHIGLSHASPVVLACSSLLGQGESQMAFEGRNRSIARPLLATRSCGRRRK